VIIFALDLDSRKISQFPYMERLKYEVFLCGKIDSNNQQHSLQFLFFGL